MTERETMSVGERDKKMSDMASTAAAAFCRKCEATGTNDQLIKDHPEAYLNFTIPYLTVRTLHRLEETLKRHETALKHLEVDSRWIKRLTFVLVALTIVLWIYAWRLDAVIHSLSEYSP